MRVWSPYALIAANVFPLIGVLLWDWDAAAIVVFYWSENLVIGALTILKLLARNAVLGWFSSAFFTIHYGGFCAVHGMLAMSLLGVDIGDPFEGIGLPFFLIFVEMLIGVIAGVLAVAPQDWIWGFVAISLSHIFSLASNYFGRGEYQEQTGEKLMMAPYRRIVVLHLAILFGGWGTLALGSPLPLLLILVVGKTLLDLRMHLREHKLSWQSLWGGEELPAESGV